MTYQMTIAQAPTASDDLLLSVLRAAVAHDRTHHRERRAYTLRVHPTTQDTLFAAYRDTLGNPDLEFALRCPNITIEPDASLSDDVVVFASQEEA